MNSNNIYLLREIIKISNLLDSRSLYREANILDDLLKKIAIEIKVHPLEFAVTLGLLNPEALSVLEESGIEGEDDLNELLAVLQNADSTEQSGSDSKRTESTQEK